MQLEGEYHIKIDPTVSPVQHPPRRVPVAIREELKAELCRTVDQDIFPCDDTNTMGQFPRGCSQEGWENKAVFGSQGPQPSDSERTLSSSNNRGRSDPFARSQGVHETGCPKRFLAHQTRRQLVLSNHIQHAVWSLPVEVHAL